jgi:hypothetical protein
VNFKVPVQQLSALPHPGDPAVDRRRGTRGIKASAVVYDLDAQPVTATPHADTNALGLRMATRVGQRFAHNPQYLNALDAERSGGNAIADLQLDLAIAHPQPVLVHEPLEQLDKRPLLLTARI